MWKSSNYKTFLLISLGLVSTVILGSLSLIIKQKRIAKIQSKPPHQEHLFSAQPVVDLNQSSDSNRNSFLLAADLIDRQQGQEALAKLQGLEQEYPLLAAYVLLAKGKAYQLEQNNSEAETAWQKIVTQYSVIGC